MSGNGSNSTSSNNMDGVNSGTLGFSLSRDANNSSAASNSRDSSNSRVDSIGRGSRETKGSKYFDNSRFSIKRQ
jgi:hypothetical protein